MTLADSFHQPHQPLRNPPKPAGRSRDAWLVRASSAEQGGPPRPARQAAAPLWQAGRAPDLLRLCALAVVESAGPLGGLEILNRLAPVARRLGELPPTFPLLHELEEDGCLAASADLPRRYRITAAGRHEALRLAGTCGSLLSERLGPGALLGTILFPSPG
ncbi:MAG: hypothetical protein ACP5VP_00505 [Candidatus Limnocylindrales bacterium]